MAFSKEAAIQLFEQSRGRFFDEWKEFLRFPSISTDPAYHQQCLMCAQWVSGHLKNIGFSSELLQTSGKPVVWAHRAGNRPGPHILFYGHYDVQPIDPLEAWTSPPFEPVERDGRMWARGAQDNKGQSFYVFKAIETLISQGLLECPVSLLIEGEEESGSAGLQSKMGDWAERLQADVLLVCDTGGFVSGVPWITMGLRGLIYLEFELGGLSHDLHSGALGGVVKNPATELARLVASLHHADGSIAIPGYYDDIVELGPRDLGLAKRVEPSVEKIKGMLGVEPLGGEQVYSVVERRGLRPTVEVNGIFSGYSGPGTKTIIPARAGAKITSRLVAKQDPERCLSLLVSHVMKNAPRGLELRIVDKGIGGAALTLSTETKLIAKVKRVLDDMSGGQTQFVWEGGSIPVVTRLSQVAHAQPLLIGFGLEEDHIHAPNESFSIEQFRLGFTSICLVLECLAREGVA